MVKELEKEFTKKGEVFIQIEKNDSYYIYKRCIETVSYFEVFEEEKEKTTPKYERVVKPREPRTL